MSESVYTSTNPASASRASSAAPLSPTYAGGPPPPPPPKPTQASHFSSDNASRSGTPIQIATPLPPTTNSPRPQPPLPTQHQSSTPAPQAQAGYYPQVPRHQQIPPPQLLDRWLPEAIRTKPLGELQPLLNNPSLLASLASQHLSYQSSIQPLDAAVQANFALARQVSQLEAQLRQLRDETARLLLNHTSLQTQWRRKQSEMDDALAPWGPRQMYQRLVSSITEQEALLRAMQESFLEGESEGGNYYGAANGGKASEKEVTEWVRRIREGVTTLEKRREMRARWDEGRVGGWR